MRFGAGEVSGRRTGKTRSGNEWEELKMVIRVSHILFGWMNFFPKVMPDYPRVGVRARYNFKLQKFGRNPVYCSWSTNPPPLIFGYLYAYFRLGLPCRVRQEA